MSRKREISGIILFASAVFLAICIVSYNSADPSFGKPSTSTSVANWGGYVGSYSADILMRLMGVSSLWIPALMLLSAIRLFRRDDFSFGWGPSVAFAGLLISSACLVSLLITSMGIAVQGVNPGGMIGKFISDIFVYILHPAGSYIFLLVIFSVCLIITIDISFAALLGRAVAFVKGRIESWNEFSEARQERREKRQMLEEKRAEEPLLPPVIQEEYKPVERPARKKRAARQPSLDFSAGGAFKLPPLTLLDEVPRRDTKVKRESLLMNARILEKKLADFGVEGKVTEVRPGPLITIYELEPAPGVKINRITNLADDLAMALKAQSVRIAPITGKSVVGVEIPNNERESVHLRNCLDNEEFLSSKYRLPIALGEDSTGNPVLADLARMPHLLIAGTTGSGKSVSLNAMVCSLLLKWSPDEIKMLMIDPKRLELSAYEGIPHLLHPVVVNPRDAAQVLRWAVQEMERRYRVISEVGVKNIEKYNKYIDGLAGKTKPARDESEEEDEAENGGGPAFTPTSETTAPRKDTPSMPLEKLPYIIIVIDEMADLIMVAQRNVEESLTRLAQMARAAGIHLILATQRPSVDVITGIIKANFPTRISFKVSSKVDSRTILDQLGAEQLLGNGDMLFIPPGTSRLIRIHGAYVSEGEIDRIAGYLKKQGTPSYDESILQEDADSGENGRSDEDYDEKYDEAVELVTELGQASISLVQRYLKVGYNRAARMIERMEAEGVVGPSDGVKPRKVLARKLP